MLNDLRYAVRTLQKAPAFALVAILSLALGIGAAVTMLAVVSAVDLRALPYPESNRLVALREVSPRDHPHCPSCEHEAAARVANTWMSIPGLFERVGAVWTTSYLWIRGDEPRVLYTHEASGDFLAMMGARPLLGRLLGPADDKQGAPLVVVLDYTAWRTAFGGDPTAIGKTMTLMGRSVLGDPQRRSYAIVGVLAPGFAYSASNSDAGIQNGVTGGIWTPLATSPMRALGLEPPVLVIGRLAIGVSREAAAARVRAFHRGLAQNEPRARGTGVTVRPLREVLLSGGYGTPSAASARYALLGVVVVVLFIAMTNVANLFLARGVAREHELSIRTALGASRSRIARQLLAESVTVSIAGGVLGTLLAVWGSRLAMMKLRLDAIMGSASALDLRLVLVSILASVLIGVAVGLAPALAASRFDTLRAGASRGMSARTARAQGAFVITQVAASLALVTSAGLLAKEIFHLRVHEVGYDPQGLYGFQLPTKSIAATDQLALHASTEEALTRSRAERGVRVGLFGQTTFEQARLEGHTERLPVALTPVLLCGDRELFDVLNIPIVRGRAFTDRDGPNDAPVAIVPEFTARRYWPGRDPIGQRIHFKSPGQEEWVTIVGVVANAKWYSPLMADQILSVFRPIGQVWAQGKPVFGPTLMLRAKDNAGAAVAAVRRIVEQATHQPFATDFIQTYDRYIDSQLARPRFNAVLLGAFALFGLLLASMGLYGVVAYAVSRRMREMGIRVALGAEPATLLRLVSRRGLALAAAGIALGLGASLALTRLLRSMLYGTSATDPLVFSGSALLLTAVVLAACYIPARRAGSVDPMIALREE